MPSSLTAEHLEHLRMRGAAQVGPPSVSWGNLVGTQTLQTVRAALAAYAHSPEPAAPTATVRLRFT